MVNSLDRVFSFASTKEAMAYVEAGRAKGKVVFFTEVTRGEPGDRWGSFIATGEQHD
jgi:hypothetical protein